MFFLYSRKTQSILLLLWFVSVVALFLYTTNQYTVLRDSLIPQNDASNATPHIGSIPQIDTPQTTEQTPPQQTAQQPPADPTLNRCTAIKLTYMDDTPPPMLVVDVDFIAAQENGVTLKDINGYYLSDEPTYVITFGAPWITDVSHVDFTPEKNSPIKNIQCIVSKSQHMRLIIHMTSVQIARKAKLTLVETDRGIQAQVHF